MTADRSLPAAPSIEKLLAGEKPAWDQFVTRYSRLIYKTFYAASLGFSPDEVDELFHDFMVSMIKDNYRKLRLYEGRNSCSLSTYLRKIAVNLAIDRRKRDRRLRTVSLSTPLRGEDGAELADMLAAPSPEPAGPLAEKERHQLYLWGLYRLDPPKLLATVMILYYDVTRERIADVMHTSRQNVDVLFKRGKDRLIDLLGGQKSSGALSEQRLEWSPGILERRDRLATAERGALFDRCVERLAPPGDLLRGLLFANAAMLRPTPDRLAKLFRSTAEEEAKVAMEVLERLGD